MAHRLGRSDKTIFFSFYAVKNTVICTVFFKAFEGRFLQVTKKSPKMQIFEKKFRTYWSLRIGPENRKKKSLGSVGNISKKYRFGASRKLKESIFRCWHVRRLFIFAYKKKKWNSYKIPRNFFTPYNNFHMSPQSHQSNIWVGRVSKRVQLTEYDQKMFKSYSADDCNTLRRKHFGLEKSIFR